MALNPHENAEEKDRARSQTEGMYPAKVLDNTLGGHVCRCRPLATGGSTTASSAFVAPILVPEHGDVNVPDEGSIVLVAEDMAEQEYVVGSLYSAENNVREHEVDERHVGADDEPTFLHGTFAAVPRVATDPPNPPDGAIWYRTDVDEYRGVEADTTVRFDTTAI